MAKIKPKKTEATDPPELGKFKNRRVKKVVLVIQDLVTKDKEVVAVVSGDVHLVEDDIARIISFQMALDSNKDFQRHIQSLTSEALAMGADKVNERKRDQSTRTA